MIDTPYPCHVREKVWLLQLGQKLIAVDSGPSALLASLRETIDSSAGLPSEKPTEK
jgi:hypothetical protein